VTTYDYAQLEGLWVQAGGPRPLAPLMAAIAMAESGGDSEAENPSGATGLWQILGDPFPGNALDPLTNAKMAVAKYHSQGLGAWTTYTSGAYKQFMKGSVPPQGGNIQTTAASGGGGGLSTVWNPLPWLPGGIPFIAGTAASVADVGTAVGQLSNDVSTFLGWISWLFVPSHWIRIICFILGVPLVGIGIGVMVKGSQPIPVSAMGVSTEISGGSIAPAMGIAEVTAGAVLLFIAFHNLPSEVQTFPQLMSYMQSKVSTGVSSKVGPGPKAPVI